MVPGTGLTYEDARGWIATDKYRFQTLERDGSVAIVEAIPRTDSLATILGTARIVIRVDAVRSVVLKADYFDPTGAQVKTYEAAEFRRIGSGWYPGVVHTYQNAQQLKATTTYRYRRLLSPPPDRLLAWDSTGNSYLEHLRGWRKQAGWTTEFPDTVAVE